MNYPFSKSDLIKSLGRGTQVLTYDELPSIGNIDTFLNRHKAFILLYYTNSQQREGHWVAVLLTVKNPNGKQCIEFFDPYGNSVDLQFKISAVEPAPRILSYLLSRSKYDITDNHHQYQALSPEVATCGRHCIMRISLQKYSLEEYDAFIKSFPCSPDEVSVMMTT